MLGAMKPHFFYSLFHFIYVLTKPRGMWDLSSPTRDRTCTLPALEAPSPNHWTTSEVPTFPFLPALF